MNAPAPSYRFDRFEVLPTERKLLRDGVPVRVGARAVDLLATLIAHRDRVLSKHELLALAWPRLHAQERHLQTGVTVLRRLIGAQAILTVPGRGFRFCAALREEGDAFELAIRPTRRSGAAPVVDASLLGREQDLLGLHGQLREQRLVTLVGPAGVGKTRLAGRVLQEQQARYRHGVVWVDLGSVAQAADVVDAVAAAMSINVGGRGDRVQTLTSALAPYHLLLALDRAEHLADALVPMLRAVLAGAPELQLLVISRVPLNMPAARQVQLAGLPASGAAGAVDLLLQRARSRDPHFALDRDGPEPLRALVQQVDGLPLALELIGSRLPDVGAAQTLVQLRAHAQGAASTPLEGVLRWAHDTLAPAEQAVLRRLAVFRGGFLLDAAQRVAGADDAEDGAFADSLALLVETSWVQMSQADPPRYLLPAAAQAFAAAQLRAAGEDGVMRQRHAMALRALFERAAERWVAGEAQTESQQAELAAEVDNGRDAIAWALAFEPQTAVAIAPGLALALAPSYRPRYQVWKATAPLLGRDLPALVRARWYVGSAVFWAWHKPELARSHARAAVDLYRAAGDQRGLYRALAALASARSGTALEEPRQALEEMHRLEDPSWPATLRRAGLIAHANVRAAHADYAGAIEAHERSLALASSAGQEGLVTQQIGLMHLELAEQRFDAAAARANAARERIVGARARVPVVGLDMVLVLARLWQGRLDEARQLAQACWPQAPTFDLQGPMACALALLAALENRPRVAARLAGFAAEAFRRAEMTPLVSARRALAQAGRAARQQLGDEPAARLNAEGTLLADNDVPALAFGIVDA